MNGICKRKRTHGSDSRSCRRFGLLRRELHHLQRRKTSRLLAAAGTGLAGSQGNAIEIVSSDLTLLEVLVAPLKSGNAALATAYEQLFQQRQTRLIPISQPILRDAARLRATTNLKTPDAVHASTALRTGCVLFITNDVSFRNVPTTLPTVILNDLLKP